MITVMVTNVTYTFASRSSTGMFARWRPSGVNCSRLVSAPTSISALIAEPIAESEGGSGNRRSSSCALEIASLRQRSGQKSEHKSAQSAPH
jgi:hypothetical protein